MRIILTILITILTLNSMESQTKIKIKTMKTIKQLIRKA